VRHTAIARMYAARHEIIAIKAENRPDPFAPLHPGRAPLTPA
jgi:hypothetical protein